MFPLAVLSWGCPKHLFHLKLTENGPIFRQYLPQQSLWEKEGSIKGRGSLHSSVPDTGVPQDPCF
jgi:hypothetical protein